MWSPRKLQPGGNLWWEIAEKPVMGYGFSPDCVIRSLERATKHKGYLIFAYQV